MKKILLSLAILVTALSLAAYTTFATWSATVTVTNNQVLTGTADLQVSTNSGGNWNTSTGASSMVLADLIPGREKNGYSFSLWNNSTPGLNFNTSGQITAATGAGADETQLEIAVYENGSSPAAGSGWISLADWKTTQRSFNSSILPGIGNFKNYTIAARLLSIATNDWQGRTVRFTLTVTGQQP